MSYIRTPNLGKFSWQNPVLDTVDLDFDYDTYIVKSGDRFLFTELDPNQSKFPKGQFSTNSIIWFDGTNWHEDIPVNGWRVYEVKQKIDKIFEDNKWKDFKSGSGQLDVIEVSNSPYYITINNINKRFKVDLSIENEVILYLPNITAIPNGSVIECLKSAKCKSLKIITTHQCIYEDGNTFVFSSEATTSLIKLSSNTETELWDVESGMGVWTMEIN